jgi:hypothetical protein
MELVFPANEPVPEHWLDPLREALDELRDEPAYAFARVRDFRPHAMVLRPRKTEVVQYQHRPSGKYLYVDYRGAVYRLLPPTTKAPDGRLTTSTIREELDALRPSHFDPPAERRPDGRPALRLIHGGSDA